MKYEWSKMTPRERDALVAEKVMEWTWQPNWEDIVPNYTTDIAAAWEVVEKFDIYSLQRLYKAYKCEVYHEFQVYVETAPTAPEAICMAALRAMGVDVDV